MVYHDGLTDSAEPPGVPQALTQMIEACAGNRRCTRCKLCIDLDGSTKSTTCSDTLPATSS